MNAFKCIAGLGVGIAAAWIYLKKRSDRLASDLNLDDTISVSVENIADSIYAIEWNSTIGLWHNHILYLYDSIAGHEINTTTSHKEEYVLMINTHELWYGFVKISDEFAVRQIFASLDFILNRKIYKIKNFKSKGDDLEDWLELIRELMSLNLIE